MIHDRCLGMLTVDSDGEVKLFNGRDISYIQGRYIPHTGSVTSRYASSPSVKALVEDSGLDIRPDYPDSIYRMTDMSAGEALPVAFREKQKKDTEGVLSRDSNRFLTLFNRVDGVTRIRKCGTCNCKVYFDVDLPGMPSDKQKGILEESETLESLAEKYLIYHKYTHNILNDDNQIECEESLPVLFRRKTPGISYADC